MAYLTQTIVEQHYDADIVAALTGGSPATMARLISEAESRVQEALLVGGYSSAVPSTVYASDASDCPPQIVELAVRVWAKIAHARRFLTIPQDQVEEIESALARIRDGRAQIHGVTRNVERAPGGVSSTPVTGNESAPKVFTRTRMRGW